MIAIDLDPVRLKCARENAKVGVHFIYSLHDHGQACDDRLIKCGRTLGGLGEGYEACSTVHIGANESTPNILFAHLQSA